MENIKINRTQTELWMSEISPKITTETRFRFNMSAQTALDILSAFYIKTVESRGGVFKEDLNTTQNLISLARFITNPGQRFGIMLSGTCGNGKTTMLKALKQAISLLNDEYHFDFMKPEWEHAALHYDAVLKIYKATDLLKSARDADKFNSIKGTPLLAIDDLGTESTDFHDYGNVSNPIAELLEHRYDRQLFTVITTNVPSKAKDADTITIRKKYGARIADRFNEMFHVIVYKDLSYRKANV